MTMLGLLELAAANDAGVDELFHVAKYANAYWFPQQMLEVAAFFRHRQNTEFAGVDARAIVARNTFSSSGFRRIHQWLADNGRLQQTPYGGDGCSL